MKDLDIAIFILSLFVIICVLRMTVWGDKDNTAYTTINATNSINSTALINSGFISGNDTYYQQKAR